MPHFPTLPTLAVSIGFGSLLLLLGMCNTRLRVGSLRLRLPSLPRLMRQASTSRPSSPTISIICSPPSPLIPKEGFPCLKVDEAWAVCDCKVAIMDCTLPIRLSNCCCCLFNCFASASFWVDRMVAAAISNFPLVLVLPALFHPQPSCTLQ